MQLLDLRSTLIRLLDEDGVYRVDSVLDNSVNDGYQITSALTQACERTTTFTYSVSNGGYCGYLPRDFFLPVGVYIGTTRMRPVRVADLELVTSTWLDSVASTPVYYWILGTMGPTPTIWLYPRPLTDQRVKLVYASIPDRLANDASIPRIPSEFHYSLVQYAYAWELLKERGPLLANKAYREFVKYIGQVNDLLITVYRRAPDRDWQMAPWDTEAVQRKMFGFERQRAQQPPTSDAQDMAQ